MACRTPIRSRLVCSWLFNAPKINQRERLEGDQYVVTEALGCMGLLKKSVEKENKIEPSTEPQGILIFKGWSMRMVLGTKLPGLNPSLSNYRANI